MATKSQGVTRSEIYFNLLTLAAVWRIGVKLETEKGQFGGIWLRDYGDPN